MLKTGGLILAGILLGIGGAVAFNKLSGSTNSKATSIQISGGKLDSTLNFNNVQELVDFILEISPAWRGQASANTQMYKELFNIGQAAPGQRGIIRQPTGELMFYWFIPSTPLHFG